MDTPKVSVAMPVYNAERYVAEAIQSILAQTLGDFEFLIIDDGSTDGSLAIIREYASRDPRIKFLSRPNKGVVKTLNEVLALCRGDLVARMDADDISMVDRLAKQVKYLEDHPECVMVGSRVQIIDPEGMPLTILSDALTHEQIVEGLLAARGQLVHHPAIMFRRRIALEIGCYREIFDEAEDLDLFLRLAEVGRIVNLEEPLLKYREHPFKAGRVKAVRVEENVRRILADAHRRRGREYQTPAQAPEIKLLQDSDIHRTWAWWALSSGHVASARKHARACLGRAPLSPASWRLFYCALRGH
jgi:glycosyltransferase involved in cell wall biosynthesis